MTLFERIHEVIKRHLGRSADENTPVDTEAMTGDVIGTHEAYFKQNPIPVMPADVTAPVEQQPEEKAAES